ncbi:hypothetical protein BCV70DRAFT_199775 [Testicularia cyperi]|uniref:DFDF domain-containing protein n=1 Tax=Testicularia cyperi TaxID=1882483 RepID=A0A317XQC0_9BASI|nr:hypothetical protein BCV70DRAFT_199775 [Testicularia cyperi]
MSSPFIGLQVKLTLHSQPGSSLHAKILSIDAAANTLTVQKSDGSTSTLNRADIASITASSAATPSADSSSNVKLAKKTAPAPAQPDTSASVPPVSRTDAATPSKMLQQQQKVAGSPKPKSKPVAAAAPASAFVDPAIMSYNRSNLTDHQPTQSAPASHLTAPLPTGNLSRSSTPSHSPRPKAAAPAASKSAKKKAQNGGGNTASRGSSPAIPPAALTDDFDFSAGLAAFDKKRIWDEIRSADNTDPASLLVSHNRIAGAPGPLIRGPNGVGPANSVSTPDRGRGTQRDGQQKLRPNEMVCSPSPDRETTPEQATRAMTPPSPSVQHKPPILTTTNAKAAAPPASVPGPPSVPVSAPAAPVTSSATSHPAGKPSYQELEEKIKRLEAELALARRRNVLLEELAGLGLGVNARTGESASYAVQTPSASVSQPTVHNTLGSDANGNSATPAAASASAGSSTAQPAAEPFVDPAILSTTRDMSSMSLGTSFAEQNQVAPRSSTPLALNAALAAAGFPSLDGALASDSASASARSTPSLPAAQVGTAAQTSKPAVREQPVFGHLVDSPVLTLLFPTAAIQHSALARMEAFYESDSSSKRYLSLQEARDERICRNYQGFNFPVFEGVKVWLQAMSAAVNSSASGTAGGERWWSEHCNDEERQVLDVLVDVGAIAADEGVNGQTNGAASADAKVTYVISTTASQANSTLPHELLHALYFLSPSYRSFVSSQWDSLTSSARKAIETDMGLRKYSPAVFQDEFQAYLAEGFGTEKEFGNKTAGECKPIAEELRARVPQEWNKLGFNLHGKEDRWESVKWETLDRFAAAQKAAKKQAKNSASPASKEKAGKKKIKK